jgi:hypothetical protein
MSNNNLTGTIPTEIGLCANASYIQIDNNHFDGTIPTQVGLMDQLGKMRRCIYSREHISKLTTNSCRRACRSGIFREQ